MTNLEILIEFGKLLNRLTVSELDMLIDWIKNRDNLEE